ncbi:hypothetical protein GNI_017360 [Gregarina niphandrodes]|uniref:Uncharacterized protein n=1 Tax=Gregarina niphandrodes TaxID=110365 RepID=A0A023BC78_GRENI|nr:hypothetical protein GNI_017360 [Gregarina niphandrodes]EZG82129.1 hypothetical protein GNI_017360 [Gregarina niphandrodes]|eukprot:XP_011129035.1 hypothetical protein GNI_017360 [Gregarina niphandrodes]
MNVQAMSTQAMNAQPVMLQPVGPLQLPLSAAQPGQGLAGAKANSEAQENTMVQNLDWYRTAGVTRQVNSLDHANTVGGTACVVESVESLEQPPPVNPTIVPTNQLAS